MLVFRDQKVHAKLAELKDLVLKREEIEAGMVAMVKKLERTCVQAARELNCVVSDRLTELAIAVPHKELDQRTSNAAKGGKKGVSVHKHATAARAA